MNKYSIITVCLNAEEQIGMTIASVLCQSYTDFEYVIKDGGSKDNTVEIARSFIPAFQEKGIPYRIISESDKGIYDAMNVATRESQGEWLLFMNAGDEIARADILDLIAKSGCLEHADIVYGDRIMFIDDLYMYTKAKDIEMIKNDMPFCHQSVFTKRQLLLDHQYSTKYRICGDYQFYLHMYYEGKKYVYCPIPISIFDKTGISSNLAKKLEELIDIQMKQKGIDEVAIEKNKSRLKNYKIKKCILGSVSRFIPDSLRKKRWRYIRIKKGWKTREEIFGEHGPVVQAIETATKMIQG